MRRDQQRLALANLAHRCAEGTQRTAVCGVTSHMSAGCSGGAMHLIGRLYNSLLAYRRVMSTISCTHRSGMTSSRLSTLFPPPRRTGILVHVSRTSA